ncbi:MAG: DNA polymerase [Prosthecochloris sp.]|nr:DNA polymerase [Prosthecochloris sp.]
MSNNQQNNIVLNPLLFGKDEEEKIVGIHQLPDNKVRLYIRDENGISSRDEAFYPFFFLSEESLLDGFTPVNSEKFWLIKLQGGNFYRFLAIFKTQQNCRSALEYIASKSAVDSEEEDDSGFSSNLTYSRGDAVTQYLLQSGKTLFKGMVLEDLHRMQLDIETYYKPEKNTRSKVSIGSDPIIIISLSDNKGWEHIIHSRDISEKELLEKLISIIRLKDPDVIEGHNIFSFDLPYIQRRCEILGVEFRIGRDGSIPRSYQSSIRFAERSIDYPFFDIAGRHVVDTLFLVQNYDVAKRSMPGYGLKAAARYFGFASPDRTYVEYSDIADLWNNNPERLLNYALDDVRETQKLAAMLSGSNFYMTRMMPYTYAQTSRMGPAAKIEALFVRDYLKEKHSLPKPETGQQHSGGFTEVFLKGILGPIVYADVESLYPSIMLFYDICPKSDERRIFPEILSSLKELRFATKSKAKEEKEKGNKDLSDNYDAMQSSFKILINAMYGYLGYSAGIFNDYEEADRVTTTGQEIARRMIKEFESRGCKVIEVDTDGILFVPPPHVQSQEDEIKLVKEVSAVMPDGITIGYDGRYRKMISYLKKNYALLNYDGTIKLKGSSLISRSGEKFGRDFIRKGFEKLLEEDVQGLHDLYVSFKEMIMNHSWSIEDFSRTESLKNTLEQYITDTSSGKRSRSITYELALKHKLSVNKGDRITYYVAGSGLQSSHYEKGRLADDWDSSKPDENTQFYTKRLDEFSQKFLPFFKPQDFSSIFSSDTLFSFSPEGIELIKEIRNKDTDSFDDNDIPF